MSILEELEADGEAAPTNLADVRALAQKQLQLEAEVAKAEQALKDAKAELRKIEQGELPAALKAAGMPSFTLENGMTVSYTEDMSVSVPKIRKDAIIEKMTEWGYGPNVSNTMTIDLGKGENNFQSVLEATAKEMGLEAVTAKDIPTGTVKKVLKKRRAEGKSDDLTFFGAYEITKATVK